MIMKLFRKKIAYNYLKKKFIDMWKPTEPLTLIDLGRDFYIAKFNIIKKWNRVLHEGPWFVTRNFLSIRKWEPHFVLEEATVTHTVI